MFTDDPLRPMPLQQRPHIRATECKDLTSVDKALALLKVFGDDAYLGVGVSELSRRAGLSKSTAFRLLGILERNELVERVGTAYRFGRAIQALSPQQGVRSHDQARELFTPFLATLFVASRHTVQLAVLEDTEVVYLNKLETQSTLRSPSRIGGRMPAYCTGVGKALIAFDAARAERVIKLPRHQWTPHTITNEHAFRVELASIRRRGIAMDRGESLNGLACIAAPILDKQGRAVAALSISGPSDTFDARQHEFLLRTTALSAAQAAAHLDLLKSA